jgi:hypothetical protein
MFESAWEGATKPTTYVLLDLVMLREALAAKVSARRLAHPIRKAREGGGGLAHVALTEVQSRMAMQQVSWVQARDSAEAIRG